MQIKEQVLSTLNNHNISFREFAKQLYCYDTQNLTAGSFRNRHYGILNDKRGFKASESDYKLYQRWLHAEQNRHTIIANIQQTDLDLILHSLKTIQRWLITRIYNRSKAKKTISSVIKSLEKIN